jgi:hypothetical protein
MGLRLFSRVERWTATGTGVSHWRTITRDNVTALYGADATGTVADPDDPARIFCWYICRAWDAKGNACVYSYAAEDGAGISSAGTDGAVAHEVNRTPRTRAAQPAAAGGPQRTPWLSQPRARDPLVVTITGLAGTAPRRRNRHFGGKPGTHPRRRFHLAIVTCRLSKAM